MLLSAVLACALLIAVTAEEAHASDQPRIVKVGYTDSEGLLAKNDDGTYEGYTYDYLMRVAQFTGWSFEFVEAEGDNANERALRLLEMLDNGEVDIEGSMSYSAALAEMYEYPENSYGSAHTALFAPNIHATVSKTNLFTRSELRVAILATAKKRRAELEYYCDQNGINLVTVECSTTQELLDKTLTGEADVFLEIDVNIFDGFHIVSSFAGRPFFFAAPKGERSIIDILSGYGFKVRLGEVHLTGQDEIYEFFVEGVKELSKVCGTTGVIVSAHTSLCAAPIYENGTPEQKEKYLPKLCSGEWLGAFGLTEPGAGTDAQGQQTTAVEDGDYWVLNGSKVFITNAGYADVFIVIAVTDKVLDKKGRPTKLCSAFIVERTDPGFSVGKAEDKMGIRGSSTCELIFEDCRIPKDRMLGVRGKGFQLAMATLDGGRIGIASQALGIAEGALEETVAYVKERKQFGRPIAAFQNTQFELAEMKARVEAAKYLVYAAALKKQQAMDGAKVRYSVEAAQAKLIAARTASDVTRRCLQLFGGYGYTRDYPIERMMRDAKITEIYEGTSEVQMMVISGALLK